MRLCPAGTPRGHRLGATACPLPPRYRKIPGDKCVGGESPSREEKDMKKKCTSDLLSPGQLVGHRARAGTRAPGMGTGHWGQLWAAGMLGLGIGTALGSKGTGWAQWWLWHQWHQQGTVAALDITVPRGWGSDFSGHW